MKNKKGLSNIIAYVLLILIAIGLSSGVYFSLTRLVPSEKQECPSGTSLIISDIQCDSPTDGEINLVFENKGRFDIDGAYIKIGDSDSAIWEIDPVQTSGVSLIKPGFFYFTGPNGLQAGSFPRNIRFDYTNVYENGIKISNDNGVNVIEVQPFVRSNIDDEILLCSDAIFVRKNIGCHP
jgi:hypothetical protein